MPGKTVDSATVDKAKQWCGKAREVLGSGYIPYSEDRQMHLRNEAVASSLKSLATANPSAFQRLGTDYKALSKEAKAAAQNRDADLSRRVSAGLELLQLEIKAELSGLTTSEEKQLFEKQSTFALNELKRLAAVADADVLRKAQVRVEGLISDHDKRRDFTAGAAALKLATVDTRQQIKEWTEKLTVWKNDHSRRSLIKTAAEQLSDDSPYRQKIQQLLDAASDVAQRVHDYALAEKFVVQSEQVLREQQDYEAPIRQKMQAFQDGDVAFLELANAVKERLDRVLQSVASKQRERRGPIPPDDAYQVLGEAGHAYLEASQLAEGFRQRVRQNRLEACKSRTAAVGSSGIGQVHAGARYSACLRSSYRSAAENRALCAAFLYCGGDFRILQGMRWSQTLPKCSDKTPCAARFLPFALLLWSEDL